MICLNDRYAEKYIIKKNEGQQNNQRGAVLDPSRTAGAPPRKAPRSVRVSPHSSSVLRSACSTVQCRSTGAVDLFVQYQQDEGSEGSTAAR